MIRFSKYEILAICKEVAPNGKLEGNEYVALNPTRADSRLGSFKINIETQAWADFATGESGGSIISYVRYCLLLKDNKDAISWCKEKGYGVDDMNNNKIEEHNTTKENLQVIVKTNTPLNYGNEIQLSEIPEDFPPPPPHPKYGQPTMIYKYKSGLVLRFNLPEGGKTFSILTPWIVKGEYQWKFKVFKQPYPLYNIENINKSLPIVIVEGEKTCEYGIKKFPNYNFITWPCGSNSVKKANWEIIKGYKNKIYIIPDNDDAGLNAAKYIQSVVGGTICRIPDGKPQGWDIADNCSEEEFNEIIQSAEGITGGFAIKEYLSPENYPFDILGYTNPPFTAIYRNKLTHEIIAIPFKNHKKEELLAIADYQFWDTFCGGRGKIDSFYIQSILATYIHKAGKFDPSRIRGYGAWIDNGKPIYNDGETINGTPINEFKTNYFYKAGKPIINRNLQPAPFPELIDIFQLLGFSNRDKTILLGWCIIAPICGALSWRPHIWITANHGSGKSTILELLINKLIGKCVFAVSSTTEAGIRQELANNAFPILYDEAEGKGKTNYETMKKVIELARKSSGNTGGITYKGTPTGRSFFFHVNSCFCFASINPPVQEAADESRISQLEYHKLDVEKWNTLYSAIKSTITDKKCEQLRLFTINNMENILESINIIKEEIAEHAQNMRFADQYAPIAAGVWHCQNKEPIDKINVAEIIDILFDGQDRDEIIKMANSLDDSIRCLVDILTIGIPTGNGKIIPVGKLAISAATPEDSQSINNELLLNTYGMGLTKNKDGFIIHEFNSEFKKLISKTDWYAGIGKVLKRIDGVINGYKTSLGGYGCSTIKIPITKIKEIMTTLEEDHPNQQNQRIGNICA